MMRRSLTLLLCAYLLLWIPFGFAVELLSASPSLGMRGPAAALELAMHGVVALFCATGGYMLYAGTPAARRVATVAVLAAAAVVVQSVHWTVLPRQTAPGEALPLLVLTVALTVVWLFVIYRLTPPRD